MRILLLASFLLLSGLVIAQTTPPIIVPRPNPPPKGSSGTTSKAPAAGAPGNTSSKLPVNTTGTSGARKGSQTSPHGAAENKSAAPRLPNPYGTGKSATSREPVTVSIASAKAPLPSHATRENINATRSELSGVNRRPLPPGSVTADPKKGLTLKTADDRQYQLRHDGTLMSFRGRDSSASFFHDGRVKSLRTAQLEMKSGTRGEKIVISHLPDKSVLVSTGPHSGYLERAVVLKGNQQVIQRTYVDNQIVFTRFYTTYRYNGLSLPHYVPSTYFSPGFYGWAYYPWKQPYTLTFRFGSDAWYASNRGYFTPSQVHPSAYSWLADFDISGVLSRCFDNESEVTPPAASGVPSVNGFAEGRFDNHLAAEADSPITPTIKDAIAEEVRQQLAFASASASGNQDLTKTELPVAMQIDHVFVVSSLLDVSTRDEQTCSLSGGDVIQVAAPLASDATTAQVRVASSKRADCPVGEFVSVSIEHLQEMQNDLRASIEAGLKELHDNQNKDGWPKAPASTLTGPPRPSFANLPLADSQVTGLLSAKRSEAVHAETAVLASAFAAQ